MEANCRMLFRINSLFEIPEDISDVCTVVEQPMLCSVLYPSLDDVYYCDPFAKFHPIPDYAVYLIP